MKTWDDVYPEYQNLSAIDKQCFIEKALNNASKDEINVPPNLKDASVYDMLNYYDKERFLDAIGKDDIIDYIKNNLYYLDIFEILDCLNTFYWGQIIIHRKYEFNELMQTIKSAQKQIKNDE